MWGLGFSSRSSSFSVGDTGFSKDEDSQEHWHSVKGSFPGLEGYGCMVVA